VARPREFDEEQVVEEAMEVFWQRGYQATSVQDLVEATGLQRGSLYGAFGDKHGLFVAALDAYMELALRRFQQFVSEADDPVDGIRDFVRRAGIDCKDPALGDRGCLVANTCSELVADDPVARARVQSFISDMRQAMADALREDCSKIVEGNCAGHDREGDTRDGDSRPKHKGVARGPGARGDTGIGLVHGGAG